MKKWLLINKKFSAIWPNLNKKKDPMPDHKKYENDALFKIEIRKKFRELLNLGFTDVYRYINRNKQEFTFWDYTSGSWQKNNGLRIDHFLVSNNILKNVQNIFINKKVF